MGTEVSYWAMLGRKALTDFIEGAVAVFALVNVGVFVQFLTFTASGLQFDRAGAVDELALILPSVAVGVAHAAVSALRRNGPAAMARLATYYANFLAWLRG